MPSYKNQYIRSFALLLSCLLALPLVGQEGLSMSQAIEIGLKNNYQVQITERAIAIAENNNTWNSAGRYPTINFNLSSDNSFAGQKNPASFLQEFTSLGSGYNANIDAAYTLFDGYKVRISKKRLEAIERQNRGDAQLVMENTINNIVLAYYQVLIQKEGLATLEELMKLSKDRIEYQEVRREFGQGGRFDLLQSEDAYFNDSTNYLIQLNAYTLAQRNLNVAMGLDELNKSWELTSRLEYDAKNYLYEDLQQKMFDNNQQLKNQLLTLGLANIDRELAESNKYPSIRVNGGANYGGNISGISVKEGPPNLMIDSPNSSSNYNLYINLGATYNLYNGKNTKRNIENAEIQENIAQLNIDDLKRGLSARLDNSLLTYNNQRQLLQLSQVRVDNAKENLDIAEERFRAAQINSFDYRTIQLNYLNAVQAQLQAIFNLKNTETELIRLTGGLLSSN